MASSSSFASEEGHVVLRNGHAVHYVTAGPSDAATTFILLHGSPGTHQDYRYISPMLLRHPNVNILAIDAPGNMFTSADAAGGWALTNDSVVDAVREAIDLLVKTRPSHVGFFVVGHSMGGQVAMQVAATSTNLAGVALLNSLGFEVPPTQRPFWFLQLTRWLLVFSAVTRYVMSILNRLILIHVLGFPQSIPRAMFAYTTMRWATQNFDLVQASAAAIHDKAMPSFLAYAKNDRLLSERMHEDVCAVLHPTVKLVFGTGGHNIQKTRADELANALVDWATTNKATRSHL
ncbi:Aste57867_9591 [Aphanomyces stellatus]|uniref:Aste57867_9591 protein n=1 Tax=Aphanomyces stellatus TaxID=120398 RepID=A0A485KN94_9STRA|nr:hypothetical protein As57867_009553 [Aphanomyces stellatus]VFT86470.1 Aste57867_9591 [Aphanomyces stellatus]